MQGWGMGMLVAGVVALILYILAPHIIDVIAGFQSGAEPGVTTFSASLCP
jgi:hypothetical protein